MPREWTPPPEGQRIYVNASSLQRNLKDYGALRFEGLFPEPRDTILESGKEMDFTTQMLFGAPKP